MSSAETKRQSPIQFDKENVVRRHILMILPFLDITLLSARSGGEPVVGPMVGTMPDARLQMIPPRRALAMAR